MSRGCTVTLRFAGERFHQNFLTRRSLCARRRRSGGCFRAPDNFGLAAAAMSKRLVYGELKVLRLVKPDKSVRIGISFERDEDRQVFGGSMGAVVKSVNPQGLAAKSGLGPGDIVHSINDIAIDNSLNAAALLRDSSGEVWISVQQPRKPGDQP